MPMALCRDKPRPGYFAEALARHPAWAPVTCAGCPMLIIGCSIAERAKGRAVSCGLFPARRAAYFAERWAALEAAAARAGISLLRED
jgi:hypothetical protein